LAGLFIFLALPALAQQPTPASANLAGQLAQTLSVTLAENDALKARAEALQAEIERLKKAAEKPAPEAK
jgi:cell division protein FtsB